MTTGLSRLRPYGRRRLPPAPIRASELLALAAARPGTIHVGCDSEAVTAPWRVVEWMAGGRRAAYRIWAQTPGTGTALRTVLPG